MIKQKLIKIGKKWDREKCWFNTFKKRFMKNEDRNFLILAYIGIIFATILWCWKWKHGGLA